MYDVIIVGGGPAGLSGAMVLGRSRRKVAVFNKGKTRNHASHAMHSFLSRDGCDPLDFLEQGRKELDKYGIKIIPRRVEKAAKVDDHFEVTDDHNKTYLCKKLLLATGIKDRLPDIEGFSKYFGINVHHCPYCDGWENSDKKIVVYGKGKNALGLSMAMKTWSDDITLLTDGPVRLSKTEKGKLQALNIKLCNKPVKAIKGVKGKLEKIVFSDGTSIPADSVFFNNGYDQSCDLVIQLKCNLTPRGVVRADKFQETNIPGLYVAGDAARDMQLVIVAAAEGTKAGVAINMALANERLKTAKF
jgi:thioredoxin reductase